MVEENFWNLIIWIGLKLWMIWWLQTFDDRVKSKIEEKGGFLLKKRRIGVFLKISKKEENRGIEEKWEACSYTTNMSLTDDINQRQDKHNYTHKQKHLHQHSHTQTQTLTPTLTLTPTHNTCTTTQTESHLNSLTKAYFTLLHYSNTKSLNSPLSYS